MDLISRLRAETASIHQALHHHELLAPLLGQSVTIRDYHFALAAFYAYYRNFETLFAPHFHAAVPSAPVLFWLKRDLRDSWLPEVSEIPIAAAIVPPTYSHCWGYLYTKQGSTLGGSVISQHLTKTLGLRPQIDQHFFAGYGKNTGALWNEFRARLTNCSFNLNHDEVVDGAVAAFKHITDCCNFFLSVKQNNDFDLKSRIETTSGTDRTTAQRSTQAMC